MIREINSQINVWLGEGDVGIGTVLDNENKACGIGFIQLKESIAIGTELGDMTGADVKENGKSVNILFANRSGIESMIKGMERFLLKVSEEQANVLKELQERNGEEVK